MMTISQYSFRQLFSLPPSFFSCFRFQTDLEQSKNTPVMRPVEMAQMFDSQRYGCKSIKKKKKKKNDLWWKFDLDFPFLISFIHGFYFSRWCRMWTDDFIIDNGIQVAQEDQKTFTDLVRMLIGRCTSDVEKARYPLRFHFPLVSSFGWNSNRFKLDSSWSYFRLWNDSSFQVIPIQIQSR